MKQKRILTWVILFVLIFTMTIPVKTVYASAPGTKKVLVWSSSNFFPALVNLYNSNGATASFISNSNSHLSSTSLNGINLLWVIVPAENFTPDDITYMKDYLKTGGRIVFCGEYSNFATENQRITSAIAELGGNCSILTSNHSPDSGTITGSNIIDSSLTTGLIGFSYAYCAKISYSGSTKVVIKDFDGLPMVVDQAVGKGRITLMTDVNSDTSIIISVSHQANNGALFLNFLNDSIANQTIVEHGGNPNENFGGPTQVQITRNSDTLTAKLKSNDGTEFTTSAEVIYDWYRGEELVQEGTNDTYAISNDDKGKDIKLKVTYGEIILTSNSITIHPDQIEVTTPAAVRITGTKKVGNTLSGQLITENGNRFTTSAAVTYEWYRLNSTDSDNGTLVGEDEDYNLVSSDADKYIKLVANYEDKIFEYTTSMIEKISSSSSSSNDKAVTGNGVIAPPSSKDIALGSMLKITNENKVVSTNSWGDKNLGGTVSNVVDKNGNYVGSMITSSESGTAKLQIEYGDFKDLQYIYKYDSITNLFIKVQEIVNIDDKNIEVPVKKDETYYVTKAPVSDNVLLKEGWNTINGSTYRVEGLDLKNGWLSENNIWYYMNDTSKARVENNWNLVNNKWYAFNEKGEMKTGWDYNGGNWYLLDTTNGDMKNGWKQEGDTWYNLASNGAMSAGWKM